ncbi:organic hydroperoxide resistance protein OhrB [Listeria grandensis FSL F6-0971]|uniref:Organic hydroperoxide resistance protein OhrB n=1 Tax=Listeria grandensis FSL F6-0971 TaxID=1265819 RepID=W7BBK4_9LIST|nr:Ohr family peroxiredoxin [Listeria grandensis]EUJ23412.1 organic hydroperoxide resistance protein OhrB [Listeria grandensis FSL F6-0971]MBC6316543.1 Ohr family peroxiredoxin [Listeria grandensis]
MGKTFFTTSATGVGGRTGTVSSNDSDLSFKLSRPKSFNGEGGSGTNPEELFALGYAGCFGSAFQSVARKEKSDAKAAITVAVSMNEDDALGGYKLSIAILAEVADVGRDEAEKIVALAHEMCPYSKATRDNVKVTLDVKIK